YSRSGGVHLGHFGRGHDFYAGLFEAPFQLLGYLLILHRYYIGQILHYGHLGAKGTVEIGELDADRTASDHDHFLGLLLQGQGLTVPDDLFAVLGQAGQFPAPGPGGNDDMVRGILGGLAIPRFDLHLFARFYGPEAVDDLDLVLFHQKLYALAHSIGHSPAALYHGPEIVAHVLGVQSIVPGMLQIFKDLGGLDKGLGGDTSPIQADPSKSFLFDNGCPEPQLGSPDGGNIAPGTTAQNNYIKLAHSIVILEVGIEVDPRADRCKSTENHPHFPS